jgi:hypothetical protein
VREGVATKGGAGAELAADDDAVGRGEEGGGGLQELLPRSSSLGNGTGCSESGSACSESGSGGGTTTQICSPWPEPPRRWILQLRLHQEAATMSTIKV